MCNWICTACLASRVRVELIGPLCWTRRKLFLATGGVSIGSWRLLWQMRLNVSDCFERKWRGYLCCWEQTLGWHNKIISGNNLAFNFAQALLKCLQNPPSVTFIWFIQTISMLFKWSPKMHNHLYFIRYLLLKAPNMKYQLMTVKLIYVKTTNLLRESPLTTFDLLSAPAVAHRCGIAVMEMILGRWASSQIKPLKR